MIFLSNADQTMTHDLIYDLMHELMQDVSWIPASHY